MRGAGLALVALHLWLLGSHVVDGRLTDPSVAARWVFGTALFGSLVVLRRLAVPALWGRHAAVIWTLVALLHWQAALSRTDAAAQPATPPVAVVAVSFTLGSALVGLGLLWWVIVRSRPDRLRPLDWRFVPSAAVAGPYRGYASPCSPRPPPARPF
jgi:hypothetical protein